MTVEQLSIYLFLFADDAVLFSDSPQGLQSSIDNFFLYCEKWKLEVNVEKTKTMIFKKGGQLNCNIQFYYNGSQLETVRQFNYLGLVLSSSGSYKLTTQTLIGKALKAMGHLFSITRGKEIPIKLMLELFDTYVTSILHYSCEFWGYYRAEEVERVHRKFLKSLLGVKSSTCNSAVYGELGRFPLHIVRKLRMIKYFFKLHSEGTNNSILKAMMTSMRKDLEKNANCNNWAAKV